MPDPAGGDIRRWRPTRWLPAALLLAVGVAAALLVDADAALAAMARHRAEALAWVALHPLLAVACYLAVYVAVVALSVPGAGALTLAGGVLFGTVAGGLYSVAAATTGATLLFLVVRRTTLRLPAGRWRGAVARMERGFGRHAFTYLLALRLAPIVPFWLVNLVPAVLVNAPSDVLGFRDGRLADVAPTLLALLGLPQPGEMTGVSLIGPAPLSQAAD